MLDRVWIGRTMRSRSRSTSAHQKKTTSAVSDHWMREGRLDVQRRTIPSAVPGSDVVIQADGDQLDQLLINLIRNATEAALETNGGVRVGWSREGQTVEVHVEDEGPGIPDTANLFVPFFTTKPQGTGIGLVLSRQIAEAHGGALVLENRPGGGCVARLRLPLGARIREAAP